MTTITYEELNSVWTIQKAVNREQRRLSDLKALAESLTPHLDGLPRARPLVGKVEQVTTMILESEERLAELNAELIRRKFELLSNLRGLNLSDKEEQVMTCRYVSCMSFKEICRHTGYTRGWVSKLHAFGLRKLKETTGNKNKLD